MATHQADSIALGDLIKQLTGWKRAGEPDFVYGDVDLNGAVSAADALEVLKSVVGKVQLNETQATVADVNGDGSVNATDALNILQKVVGKIDQFPVEKE
jgi:hypothetical protein